MAASPRRLNREAGVYLIIAFVLIAAVLVSRATRNESEPLLPHGALRVGIDPSYPPLAFYDGDQPSGFEVDLALLLAQELGVSAQLIALGYDGLYDALKVDRVDLLIAALSPDPLRTADVRYSLPYLDNGLLLVSSVAQPIPSMQALSGDTLALAFGSSGDTEARRWTRRIRPFTTLPFETPSHALDAVRLGAARAALVDAIDLAVYAVDQRDWQYSAVHVTHLPLTTAARADRASLIEAIDRLLKKIEADGRLQELRRRWLSAR